MYKTSKTESVIAREKASPSNGRKTNSRMDRRDLELSLKKILKGLLAWSGAASGSLQDDANSVKCKRCIGSPLISLSKPIPVTCSCVDAQAIASAAQCEGDLTCLTFVALIAVPNKYMLLYAFNS